jgi:hypothetical protein
VFSESFGGYPIPDSTQDITRQFNEQAFNAGAVVVESSGDSGVEASPSSAGSDPDVIDAGASTTFRNYAQGTVDPNAPDFTPLTLAPGQRGTMILTITPSRKAGTVMNGTLYVDVFSGRFAIGGRSSRSRTSTGSADRSNGGLRLTPGAPVFASRCRQGCASGRDLRQASAPVESRALTSA